MSSIPQFGPLQGVRVIHQSISVAGPFCAALMADLGAEVIWIENPYGPDVTRAGYGYTIQADRRNQRTISLDISKGDGKIAFLEMLKECDIFIEASKPGQYEKWGAYRRRHVGIQSETCHHSYFRFWSNR